MTSTKQWLESGVARIDGHQGHYIRQYLADGRTRAETVAKVATTADSDTPTVIVLITPTAFR